MTFNCPIKQYKCRPFIPGTSFWDGSQSGHSVNFFYQGGSLGPTWFNNMSITITLIKWVWLCLLTNYSIMIFSPTCIIRPQWKDAAVVATPSPVFQPTFLFTAHSHRHQRGSQRRTGVTDGRKFCLIKTQPNFGQPPSPDHPATTSHRPPYPSTYVVVVGVINCMANLYKPGLHRDYIHYVKLIYVSHDHPDEDNKTQLNLLISNYGAWASHKITHPQPPPSTCSTYSPNRPSCPGRSVLRQCSTTMFVWSLCKIIRRSAIRWCTAPINQLKLLAHWDSLLVVQLHLSRTQ